MNTASDRHRTFASYLWISAAALLYAVAFDGFYAPNQIGFGGITGLGQALNALFPALPVGGTALALNIPLFLLGWRRLGGRLLVSSLFAMSLSSLLVDALALLIPFQPMDRMLSAVCGGAVVGLSLGVVFSRGATTGGTDLAARLLKLRPGSGGHRAVRPGLRQYPRRPVRRRRSGDGLLHRRRGPLRPGQGQNGLYHQQ